MDKEPTFPRPLPSSVGAESSFEKSQRPHRTSGAEHLFCEAGTA